MVIELAIIILLWILLIGISTNSLYQVYKKNKSKISFKESMDLTELPVITFMSDNTKLNFLLDTGSNDSFINESVVKSLNCKMLNTVSEVIGIEGKKIKNNNCELQIKYKDYEFNTQFNIINLDESFNLIKQESGVQIHGILGSLFFQKYKYVIDFESLIAYTK